MSPSREPVSLRAAAFVALALGRPTAAAEPAPAEAAPAPTARAKAPAFRIVGFTDADVSENCSPGAAALGACVEEVQILDLRDAWSDAPLSRADEARLHLIGELYAGLWDDLALRWPDEEDTPATLYAEQGLTALPFPDLIWESSNPSRKPRYSLPDRSLWLDPARVVEPASSASAGDGRPFFRRLRWTGPAGLEAPPEVVMLRGRTAQGLRAGAKAHPFDLMDADAQFSSPFYEQVYPFPLVPDEVGLRGHGYPPDTSCTELDPRLADAACPPLWRFQVPEPIRRGGPSADEVLYPSRIWQPVVLDESRGYAGLRDAAAASFDVYFLRIANAIGWYGVEDLTDTNLRVLATLLAMHSPPDIDTQAVVIETSHDNPGTPGETDSAEDIQRSFRSTPIGGGRGPAVRVNPDALPIEVVELGLRRARRALAGQPMDDLVQTLRDAIAADLSENVRTSCPPIDGDVLAPERIDTWASECAVQGQDLEVARRVRRVALAVGLRQIGLDALDRQRAEETVLLMAHAETSYIPGLKKLAAPATSPAATQEEFTKRITDTLKAHGVTPGPLKQGPGGPNPLAVCGRSAGAEALDEASIRPISVDLLVAAARGLKDPGAVLWEGGARVPFQAIDNPASWGDPGRAADPQLTALTDLPGDRSLYRVRWQIWSGWHLLWRAATAPRGGDAHPLLSVNVGAFCEDTVLASPELVPTLLHAALLDDPMRSSSLADPPGRARSKDEADAPAPRTTDEALETATSAGQAGQQAATQVESQISSVREDPTAIMGLGESVSAPSGGEAIAPGDEDGSSPAAWLRGVAREAIARELGTDDQLTLVVLDLAEGVPWRKTWHVRPRTPYVTEQVWRGRQNRRARGALWAVVTPAETVTASWPQASPNYLPTNSVRTLSSTPRWKRRDGLDFWLAAALGPEAGRMTYRWNDSEITSTSAYEAESVFTAECGGSGDQQVEPLCWTGVGAGVSALMAWWGLDNPRVALELGTTIRPMVSLRMSPLAPDQDFRFEPQPHFAAGLSAGVRLAPGPMPLRWSVLQGYPWGAEGPDARSRLRREQVGLRTTFTISPDFVDSDGNTTLLGDLGAEIWLGWSFRRSSSSIATLTPYRPNLLIGPFAQGRVGVPLGADPVSNAPVLLHQRATLIIGIEGQLRLGSGTPKLPEAE